MKNVIYPAACLVVLALTPAFGQLSPPPPAPLPSRPMSLPPDMPSPPSSVAKSTLPKFDLDFNGGTPAQLVKAIETATGKPLNVIINKEDANVELPPLKMNDVSVAQLFQALEAASRNQRYVHHTLYNMSYGFKTTGFSCPSGGGLGPARTAFGRVSFCGSG